MKKARLLKKGVIILALALALLLMLVSCDRENTGENNNGQNNTEQNNAEQSNNNNKEDINIGNSSEGKQEENKDQSLEWGYSSSGNAEGCFYIAYELEKNQYSVEEDKIPIYISFGINEGERPSIYYDTRMDYHYDSEGIFIENPRINVIMIYDWAEEELLHSFSIEEFFEKEYYFSSGNLVTEGVYELIFEKKDTYYIDTARLISAYENGEFFMRFTIENLDEDGNGMGHGRGTARLFYEIEDGYITFSTIAPPKYYK